MNQLELLMNSRLYVASWIARPENAEVVHSAVAFQKLMCDYDDEFTVFKIQTNSKNSKKDRASLKDAFEYITAQMAKQLLVDARNKVLTTGENLQPLENWLKALCGEARPLDVAVMAHWIWQVKRKALNLPVVYHIMPIFYGKQGSGKSTAITKLIHPLRSMWASFAMDQIADSRNYQNLADALIAFFDELQRIQKTDLNVLKNQITTEQNTYRVLGSHKSVTVPQRCSFIGATNTPLNENFSDATGMRRFFQITTLDVADWKTIEQVDALAIWQGIDEHKKEGYQTEEIRTQLTAHQEAYKDEDVIDLFIEEFRLEPANDGATKLVTTLQLFLTYDNWARTNGAHHTSSQWVTKRLKNKGFKVVKENYKRFVVINKAAVIGLEGGLLSVAK